MHRSEGLASEVVAISCVRNEEDVVEAFVRHTVHHVDRLLMVDHGSTDGTSSILAALADEGLPLEVRRIDRPGKIQAELSTALLREAGRRGAAWIVPLDADELLQVGPDDSLRLPDGGPLSSVRWRTYVITDQDDDLETNPVVRIRHRLADEPFVPRVLVPGELARHDGVVLTQGGHSVLLDGALVEARPLETVWLAHFPIRDLAQYAEKVATRWLNQMGNSGTAAEVSFFDDPVRHRLGYEWSSFADSLVGAIPPYLGAGPARDLVYEPARYDGSELLHRGGPGARELGGVLGRSLLLAERVVESVRQTSGAAPAPSSVRVHAVADGVAATLPFELVERSGSLVLTVGRCDISASALELRVGTAPVAVEVERVAVGDLEWRRGASVNTHLTTAAPACAILPHSHRLGWLQSLPDVPVRIELPGTVDVSAASVELKVIGDPATVGRRMLDRAQIEAVARLTAERDRLTRQLVALDDELTAARNELHERDERDHHRRSTLRDERESTLGEHDAEQPERRARPGFTWGSLLRSRRSR